MASSPPSPLLPPRGRRVHPLRWPLIILTFPFSVLAFLLQTLFGWLPSVRLVSRRGLIKLAVIVGVFWLVLGQLTMLFDSYSGIATEHPAVLRSAPFRPLGGSSPVRYTYPTNRACEDVVEQRADIGLGDWPLGKPFALMTACSSFYGSRMLRSVGLTDWAGQWSGLAGQVREDWLIHGRLGIAYFLLGIGLYLQIVLFVPWLIYIVITNIVTRLRWES